MLNLIGSREVAQQLGQGHDYVQRRMNPDHPEHIPNIKIGKKRYVKPETLDAWVNARLVTSGSTTSPQEGERN